MRRRDRAQPLRQQVAALDPARVFNLLAIRFFHREQRVIRTAVDRLRLLQPWLITQRLQLLAEVADAQIELPVQQPLLNLVR